MSKFLEHLEEDETEEVEEDGPKWDPNYPDDILNAGYVMEQGLLLCGETTPAEKEPAVSPTALFSTTTCDWANKGRCIHGLTPIQCRFSGGCMKYAHHVCTIEWAGANNLPEGGIATLCREHYPQYQNFTGGGGKNSMETKTPADVSIGVRLKGSSPPQHSPNTSEDNKEWPRCHWSYQEKCCSGQIIAVPTSLTQGVLFFGASRMASKNFGLRCREHLSGYFGVLYSDESYNNRLCKWFLENTLEYDEMEPAFEPCIGELNSNGLWFAPDCKECFLTNKYQSIGDKLCSHAWEEHRLNLTGQYVLLSAHCFHWGYYNDRRRSIFVTAQLFCVPSADEHMDRLSRSKFSLGMNKTSGDDVTGRAFISGKLAREFISDLMKQCIHQWDEAFPLPLFKPCDHFQLQDVDPASNRQIEKQHFKKVPLINGLVEKFQKIFPQNRVMDFRDGIRTRLLDTPKPLCVI